MENDNLRRVKSIFPAPAAAFQAAAVFGYAAASDTFRKPGSFSIE